MASKPHHAHTFTTLAQFLEYKTTYTDQFSGLPRKLEGEELQASIREASILWKQHLDKHGNVPLIVQCGVCSGEEFRQDIKHGRYKPSRPNKAERDESKISEPEKD